MFPSHHQNAAFVFGHTVNNSGFSHVGFVFIFMLGFLQAQYTYTGYDASAHMSEETQAASRGAAKGVINSVLISAIAGWVLILALTFAIQDLGKVTTGGSFGTGFQVIELLKEALGTGGTEFLLFVAVIAQLLAGMSSVTSASRMLYAFSRDRATPGWQLWSKLSARRVPANGVVLICVLAFLRASPAWSSNTAFVYVAVTSIATIGLYIAYVLPIFLRLRAGSSFHPGPWSLGRWHKPLNVISIVWVVFICFLFIAPTAPAGVPWLGGFDYKSLNYAPVALGVTLLAVAGWWILSARRWFKGPIRTIDPQDPAPPVVPPATAPEAG